MTHEFTDRPSASQISPLRDILREKYGHLYSNLDEASGRLYDITDRQYRYILHLHFSKKHSEMNKMLTSLGFVKKSLTEQEADYYDNPSAYPGAESHTPINDITINQIPF